MRTLIVFLISVLLSIQLDAQVFQASKLPFLLNQSRKDSIANTERIAAIKFHRIINEYRNKNKLDSLAWDDTLWVAARNHCVWMETNNELSHIQKEGTKYFTGNNPGDRYDYASANKGLGSWSGENALYNFSDNGSDIEAISNEMAEQAFTQWKNSPGHDQNMRAPSSRSHAVAFILDPSGKVWATDLFSYQSFDKPNASLASEFAFARIKFPAPDANTKTVSTKKPGVKRLSKSELEQTRIKLLALLENSKSVKKSKAMAKAANRHAEYLATAKKLTHTEKKNKPFFYGVTEKNRMMKASFGLYFFSQRKMPLSESIAQVTNDIAEQDLVELAAKLNTALDEEKKLVGPSVSAGYGITIKQVKNQLKVFAVRLEGVKSGTEEFAEVSEK